MNQLFSYDPVFASVVRVVESAEGGFEDPYGNAYEKSWNGMELVSWVNERVHLSTKWMKIPRRSIYPPTWDARNADWILRNGKLAVKTGFRTYFNGTSCEEVRRIIRVDDVRLLSVLSMVYVTFGFPAREYDARPHSLSSSSDENTDPTTSKTTMLVSTW